MANYWQQVAFERMTRRRAMTVAGTAAVGTALLAACGGSGDKGGSPQVPNLVIRATDDSKAAVKGGVYKGISPLNLLQIDPHQPGGHIGVVRRVYSQLFRIKD